MALFLCAKEVFMDRTINKDHVLSELASIAFANALDYLQVQDGALQILDTDRLSRETAAAVASVERATGGLKVKFYDKLKALELLGKYLSLFDGGGQDGEEKGLLEALLLASAEEVEADAVPEVQQPTTAGTVLVESPGTCRI